MLDFPSSPQVDDTYSLGSKTWKYTGSSTWILLQSNPSGPQGVQGVQGAQGVGFSNTAWTSYTPSWTSSGTAPSLGNGTISGKYKQNGKVVFVRVQLVIGSSTTTGSGNWRISLPVDAADTVGIIMPSTYYDSGVDWYTGVVTCEYDGSISYVVPLKGSSPSGAITSTVPFTWGTSDTLTFNGSYEAS